MKKLDKLLEENNYISDKQIREHTGKWLAPILIFLLKRSGDFSYTYTWIDKTRHSRLFVDYKFEVPKEERKNVEIRFTRNEN